MGLPDQDVHTFVRVFPQIFSDHSHEMLERFETLKLIFPKKGLVSLIILCPNLLVEDMGEINAKIAYINEEMGLEQTDMVRCYALSYPLEHIQLRHTFVDRCGKYVYPGVRGKGK